MGGERRLATAAAGDRVVPRGKRRSRPADRSADARKPTATAVRAVSGTTLTIGGGSRRIALIAMAIGAISLVIAAAALTYPQSLFVESPAVRAASETVAGLAALGAGWIALLRAERTMSSSDLA